MIQKKREADLLTLKQGEPFLRGILAFILYVRFPDATMERSYVDADKFIDQLKQDLS